MNILASGGIDPALTRLLLLGLALFWVGNWLNECMEKATEKEPLAYIFRSTLRGCFWLGLILSWPFMGPILLILTPGGWTLIGIFLVTDCILSIFCPDED